jgi:transposase
MYRGLRADGVSIYIKDLRLESAEIHVKWTVEDWKKVLWSDEIWVTGGRHTKTWATRRQGEELDETCIIERRRRKQGWLFWVCFSGITGKGPDIFWEKEWETTTAETYSKHIVPIVDGWIRMHPNHIFMHDNAPGHSGELTVEELESRGIRVLVWPPFFPDLNPIKTVWDKMKDYIAFNFPGKNELRPATYGRQRSLGKGHYGRISTFIAGGNAEALRGRNQG